MHVSAFLFIDLFYLVLDEFGKACGTSYDRIPKDTKIYVDYTRKEVSFKCDEYTFRPPESDEFGVEDKVCLKMQNFTDPDCEVH